ncbi:MAG: helix-hairpin-helix domain-containing protein [Oscillospiraceae bacterium]|nr:helix-hairpin-helix domain-containing protein [Oscillospiraceae bacterium]
MRNKVLYWLIPSACALLAAVLLGFFLGRNTITKTLRVQTERTKTAEISEQVPVQTATALVDLNTADVQMLMTLPGVGEVLAQRIIEYRNLADGFVFAEQLLEVEGVGEAKFAQLRPYITVEGRYEDLSR